MADEEREQRGAEGPPPRPEAREPRPEEAPAEEEDLRNGRKGVSESLRKALASGIRTVLSADDALREGVREGVPREALAYVMRQSDAMKDEIVRITGQQVRRFLENLDVADILQRMLTSVSFEIRTEIRFVPNDQAVVSPRAKVRATTRRKRKLPDGTEEVEETEEEVDPRRLRRGRLGAAVDRALGVLTRELANPPREGDEGEGEGDEAPPTTGRRRRAREAPERADRAERPRATPPKGSGPANGG